MAYWEFGGGSLYSPTGRRKYVNIAERAALLSQLASLRAEDRLLILMLAYTGARVSEVLSLTASAFQLDTGVVAIRTLKRRGEFVRELLLPPSLITELERCFELRLRNRNEQLANERLWPIHRVTAWKMVRKAMARAGIHGVHATPRGLRHSLGVTTLAAGLPLTLVQRMLGHASIKTTAIYTQVAGPEERLFISRFWNLHPRGFASHDNSNS
jgi:integrase